MTSTQLDAILDLQIHRSPDPLKLTWGSNWGLHRGYPPDWNCLIQSENECGDIVNNWDYGWYVSELCDQYITQGVSAYVYWNFILEPRGESTWGWKQNSLFTAGPSPCRPVPSTACA